MRGEEPQKKENSMKSTMKKVVAMVVVGLLAGSLPGLAQDKETPAKQAAKELQAARDTLKNLERDKAVREEMDAALVNDAVGAGLLKKKAELAEKQKQQKAKAGELRKQVDADPEVVALKKAMDDAKKAYEKKVDEKTAATPEGAALKADMAALAKESDALSVEIEKARKDVLPKVKLAREMVAALEKKVEDLKAEEKKVKKDK
jgi:DNA-binding XRE family transcriptional regulator